MLKKTNAAVSWPSAGSTHVITGLVGRVLSRHHWAPSPTACHRIPPLVLLPMAMYPHGLPDMPNPANAGSSAALHGVPSALCTAPSSAPFMPVTRACGRSKSTIPRPFVFARIASAAGVPATSTTGASRSSTHARTVSIAAARAAAPVTCAVRCTNLRRLLLPHEDLDSSYPATVWISDRSVYGFSCSGVGSVAIFHNAIWQLIQIILHRILLTTCANSTGYAPAVAADCHAGTREQLLAC